MAEAFHSATIMGDTVYPSTVVPARYGGVYEGANWLAFPLFPTQLPEGWDGGDCECAEFFGRANRERLPIGRGETPNQAHNDLKVRLWTTEQETPHDR